MAAHPAQQAGHPLTGVYTARLALMALVFLVACGQRTTPALPGPTPPVQTSIPQPTASPALSKPAQDPGPATTYTGYTHVRLDGNRLASGKGDLAEGVPLDIPLAGNPAWLVGAPLPKGSLWAAVLEDGQVQAFRVHGRSVQSVILDVDSLPAGAPPILIVQGERTRLGPAAHSPFSPPVPLADGTTERWAIPLPEGDILVFRETGEEEIRLPVAALPDARLLSDGQGRLLTLSQPTERYPHGVLGDGLEAGGFTLIDLLSDPPALRQISLPEPLVVEGIAPLWVDVTQDGEREVIVTASDNQNGARLMVYNLQGKIIAQSQAIGQGFRWRHQIAAGPFGPQGGWEIAAILTPHIGGVAEFFRLSDGQLARVATLPGYSSHPIGSRNLDMAAGGDFDGDGHLELLVPTQDRTRLGAIRRTADGAQAVWHLPVGGRMTTNLGVVSFPDGRLAVGVGSDAGSLRLWLPRGE